MISTKATDYCHGDITKITNYRNALNDKTQVWFVYHKNLLTGVGRLNRRTLQSLGKYYGVPPEDLVFARKQDIRLIEEHFPKTRKDGKTAFVVFQFWMKLNPNTPFIRITEKEFDEIYRSVRRLRILWNQMKARCYNENAQDYRHYGAKGVKMCRQWYNDSSSFVLWALQNGYRYVPKKRKGDQLSIDRIDSTKNYCPSNCRWILQRENCGRTRHTDRTQVIDRAYYFAKLFPMAASIAYGQPRIDWKIVKDNYLDGDINNLVQFLSESGYCSMAIWRIRKALGDVVPQKKSERNQR